MTYWPHSDPDPAGTGLRECARGAHCAARTTVLEDGRLVTRPAATPRPFCDPCTGHIRAAIGDLPARYAELAARMGERPRRDGPRVSGGNATPPVPLNLAYDAAQREMVDVVLSWEEVVRARAHLTPVDTRLSRRARPGAALARGCRTLTEHLGVLLALQPVPMLRTTTLGRREVIPQDAPAWVNPTTRDVGYLTDLDGVDAAFELLNVHHRALARLGWTPRHHDLKTPCQNPGCELPRLRRCDGTAGLADHVECRACGDQYVGERLLLIMAAEERAHLHSRKKAS